MTDILDLDGWTVIAKTTEDGCDMLDAEYRTQPTACLKCGVVGELYRHGTKPVTYLDSPIRGNPAKLRAKVQRYRCTACKETFLQPLGGIQTERRMTERCATYIQSMCLRDTFTRISEHLGCDDKTVRNLAGEYIAELEAGHKPQLPTWLGIDETQIDGKMRLVITDVGHRKPIDMLPDRDKDTLTTWLNHFRDRSMVKGVATDMWRPYLQVAKYMLPGVPVVVDKFHVVRTASYCMEKVRIRLQKGRKAGVRKAGVRKAGVRKAGVRKAGVRKDWLQSKALLNMRYAKLSEKQRFNVDMWLDNEPELAAAHKLKEAFYDIYDLPKAEAVAAYDAYPGTVPAILKADFKVLLTSMKNWRTEILAYFDHPITNAYTEALNGVAKAANRAGRGYSFEVLRARILFGKKAKPSGQPWVLTTTFPANPIQIKMLAKEQDNRCQNCGIQFGRKEDDKPVVAVVMRGDERKQVLTCKLCNVSFHTEALKRHTKDSTP